MPDWYAEKSKYMYKHKQTGNTIIKEEIRQHKTNTIRANVYISNFYQKRFLPIDTKFFTASFSESYDNQYP